MSPSESQLSAVQYGHDIVVATTQESINATMLNYMASCPQPQTTMCFVYGPGPSPGSAPVLQPIDYHTLITLANGTDPFKLPANLDVNGPEFNNLLKAKFVAGFQATMGIPNLSDPTKTPDVLVLGSSAESVQFNLLCSDFKLVKLQPQDAYGFGGAWTVLSQPQDKPWYFSPKVDLRLSAVAETAYDTLPPDVKAQVKNMSGTAFSVQQLLFDLSQARLVTDDSQFTGIEPGTTEYTLIKQYYMEAYFSIIKRQGQPLLGCTVVPQTASQSTLKVTDLNLQVSPYHDSKGKADPSKQAFSTLNYLCATGNSTLGPAMPFNWNWVDAPVAGTSLDYHGVISINRNTLAKYFDTQLSSYVSSLCFEPNVHVDSGFINTDFSWDHEANQMPTVTWSEPGNDTVLAYHWLSKWAYDEGGVNGCLGQLGIQETVDVSVEFKDDKITITQHLKIHLLVSLLTKKGAADVYDKTIIDTYHLSVNADGGLEASAQKPQINDDAGDIRDNASGWAWFSDYDDLANDIATWVGGFGSQAQHSVPVGTIRSFVFPGGQSFTFKDACFSEHQDLVAKITYADPGKAFTAPPGA